MTLSAGHFSLSSVTRFSSFYLQCNKLYLQKMDAEEIESNRRKNWAVRLEDVLNDFDALQCFQSWLGVDDDSSEHPVRLHFAIIAFREMSARGDARSFQLAREIFCKFLRLRVGLCDFIDAPIRERIGLRLKNQLIDDDLFDECQTPLNTFLRKQHTLFVQSQDFLDLFNEFYHLNQQQPSTSDDHALRPSSSSGANWPQTLIRRSRRRDNNSGDTASKAQPLTADSLLRSQREREAIIPAGGAGLFKPVTKFPYVGQAHASKKDSAVSSSFSSEANRRVVPGGAVVVGGGSHSMRQLRESQRRANQQKTHLLNAFPMPELASVLRETNSGMPPNRHETVQGRREFAEKLAQKLRHVELQLQHEESVNRQIDRINSARQKGTKTSTRELIITGVATDSLLLDDTAADDADDDVENYFKRRMMDSSSANSAQQSPPLILHSQRTHRKSGRSCSPTTEDIRPFTPQQQKQQSQQIGGTLMSSDHMAMSQSCYQPSFERHFDLQINPSLNVAQMVHDVHHSQLAQRPHFPSASTGQPFPAFFQAPSSSSPHQPSPHLHLHHAVRPPPSSSALSQSVHLSGSSAIPAPTLSKQPSSFNPMKQLMSVYCDNDGDTSGIGSMTTTHSGNSAPGGNDKQRAAMFRRARELSSGGGSERNAHHQQGLFRGGRRDQQQPNDGELITRPTHHNAFGRQHAQQLSSPSSSKMAICYRDISGDGVPVVAHVPQRPLTFREFRHYLSISSKDRRQFFFKSTCEDGSAPYQLLLISDDVTFLPVFEGKVSAECHAPLSDSD